MRYIDIELLELPEGWQDTADLALNSLRDEISKAEANALATGGDISAARKAAITAGLGVSAREKIWRDLNARLAKLSNNKCWYSESCNPTADKNVDHFRPKNRVNEDPSHEGYWWKAFDWKNYRYASQWCNQRRVDKTNGTSGGKWDCFPLSPGSFRARQEADDIVLEDVMLLDPADPDDWKLLTFRTDGHPTPTKAEGCCEHERAKISIDVYHLHCKELVDDRKVVAGKVRRTIENMEILLPKISDPHIREVYKRHEIDLLRMINPISEYSSAALAYARAEIYKQEFGNQVKREWLEKVLN